MWWPGAAGDVDFDLKGFGGDPVTAGVIWPSRIDDSIAIVDMQLATVELASSHLGMRQPSSGSTGNRQPHWAICLALLLFWPSSQRLIEFFLVRLQGSSRTVDECRPVNTISYRILDKPDCPVPTWWTLSCSHS